ncbi:putative MFS-type transporter YhjX [Variibacter gotjawalensis]|uniref:Putative MFS-type transporter YhjX n=1 Tax=Variibacter gotjawalensis TaxID=1333996 RepID=A0A0S3PXN4_9BRAD|nr:MFS transporter [Variibacter gotjawalensis]NIK46543.1 MFS family permease [Variibacter gotjawalensis]RZS48448.1 sugar phosphate permease [Variibacter gotjawalensis]BAT60709.1 putative MFS-type transporter YhjX [Variibacter gotjawalensis]
MRLPFFYGWIVVAVTFVTMGIGVNARTAFSLLFSPIVDEFNWQRGVTAGAFSFGFVVSGILSPVIGRIMDRYGPRAVMELGVVLMGAGLLLAPLTTQPWHLYATIGVLVGGGSVCLGYSGQSLFLPNWFVRKRGLAVGIAFAGVGVGSITLLPWFQHMIGSIGWRNACVVLGLIVLVVLAPINFLLRKRPEDMGLYPDGDGAPVAGVKVQSNVVDQEWAAIDWTLARAVKTARFWWLALCLFCGLYAWYAVQIHQTKYLTEIGFNAEAAAWALGFVSLFGIPGQIWLGHVSDRIGRELVWSISTAGFVICYVCLILLKSHPNFVLLYVMVIAQGFLGYGVTSIMGAVVAEIFEGKHFGAIFGTLMVAALAGGACGPWLTGLLHDQYDDYFIAFTIAIGISALSGIALWMAAPGKVRSVAGRTPKAG